MSLISKWKEKISRYVDVRLRLLQLGFVEKTSRILGYLVFILIALFLSLAILLLLGMGLSEFFSALTDSRTAGYFITAGVYIILLLLLMGLQKRIVNLLGGIFVKTLTDDDEEQKEANEEKESA